MLRLLVWGDTPREKEQAQEILRLHAQLVDLQEKLYQTQQEAARNQQATYDGLMAFLRPQASQEPSQKTPARVLPGDRPSTAPDYPKPEPPPDWAQGEVATAVPV